jgi:uncharacterized membrane protein
MLVDLLLKPKSSAPGGPTRWMSLGKAVSWRIVGTLDTIVISFFITGRWNFAISIGLVEVFTKIFLFYLHDRAWEYFRK